MWKLQIFTATVYSQKFRQINVLLKNSSVNWFDGKNCVAENFAKIPSNWRFTKELYCKLIWRKKFVWAENFSFFHTVSMEIMHENYLSHIFCQKFRESNGVTKVLISRNIFSLRENVWLFHTVHCCTNHFQMCIVLFSSCIVKYFIFRVHNFLFHCQLWQVLPNLLNSSYVTQISFIVKSAAQ